jgi:hypothetical protein
MSLQVHDSNCDDFVSHPNDKDQLPGRLQRLQPPENQNAGPVNCIRWFGLKILNVPVSPRFPRSL